MIKESLYLLEYEWCVNILIGVTKEDIQTIETALREVGCEEKYVDEVNSTINENKLHSGFTYSDLDNRESLIIIILKNDKEEFINSIISEVRHLHEHIIDECEIEEDSDESYYIMGKLTKILHQKIKNYYK